MFNLNIITKKSCSSIVKIYGSLPDLKTNLCTDSRKAFKNCFFLALKGDNFDSHTFIPKLLDNEISVIVYNQEKYSEKEILKFQEESTSPLIFISCTDTELFLQELSNHRIKMWKKLSENNLVIGITGSNGKTTNKEMLFFLLNEIYPNKVICTKGNLNNHLGVPFSILDINDEHQISIIEMGSNHSGEIDFLCNISEPDCGLITNIGNAHLEFFKSIENIFKEKSSLYNYVLKNSKNKKIFVINDDDKYLSMLKPSKDALCFGENHVNKIEYINDGFVVTLENKRICVSNINIKEKYNLLNLAQTLLLCLKLYPAKSKQLIEAASSLVLPSMNRSQWLEEHGKTIFLDAYNANPTSMKASLESFFSYISSNNISLDKCLFVLGDMNELGEFTRDLHINISKYLLESGAQHVIAVGQYGKYYAEFLNKVDMTQYNTTEEAIERFEFHIENVTHIFIKGSRSLKLENLLAKNSSQTLQL